MLIYYFIASRFAVSILVLMDSRIKIYYDAIVVYDFSKFQSLF